MTAALAILNALRKLPQWAWGVLIFLALAAGVRWLHLRSVEMAILTDRREQAALAKVERDSLLGAVYAKAQWKVEEAEARTRDAWAARDRAVARTRQLEQQLALSQRRVAAAVVRLPDSVRRIPAVDTLVRACTALANDCEQLRSQIVVERAAVDTAKSMATAERRAREQLQAISDSATTKASRIIADQARTIQRSSGRLSKKAALGWFIVVRAAEEGVRALIHQRGKTP